MVVNLVDQKPKPSETHSSTLPQDSDSESEIELRSTQTSPETTTSEESDGTLVRYLHIYYTHPILVRGRILSVGTLPLTDQDPPERTQGKDPPPGSSESEGPSPTSSKDI